MISAVLLFNSIVRYLVAFAMYKLTVSAKVIDINIYTNDELQVNCQFLFM